MKQAKNGDTAVCANCGQPIEFLDGPGYLPMWFHPGRVYPKGAGAHPSYCSEMKATPA